MYARGAAVLKLLDAVLTPSDAELDRAFAEHCPSASREMERGVCYDQTYTAGQMSDAFKAGWKAATKKR